MSIHSVHIPFYSRPLSVGVSITFFRPLFVCFLCIHPTVASGRFPRLLERGRDHFRPMQEERWRRPSSRFIPRWRRSLSLPPSSPPPPPPLATSLYFRWEWRRTLRQSSFVPLHSHRFLGDVGIMIVCVGVCMEVWVCSLVSLVLFFFVLFFVLLLVLFLALFLVLFLLFSLLFLFFFLVLCLVLPRSLFVSFVFVFSLLFFRLFVLFVFVLFCLCFLSFVLFSFSPVPLAFGCVVCVSLSCQFGALCSLSLFLCLIFLALALVFSPLFPLRFFPFLFSCFTPCVFRGLVSLLDYYWVLLLVLVVVLRIAFLLCNYHCFLHFAFYPRNRC